MNIILFEQVPQDRFLGCDDFRYAHIRDVLHLQAGDSFFMGEVNGPSGMATITAMDEHGLEFLWQAEHPHVPLYPVGLLVGHVRPICMKRILREAVSLGVESIMVSGTDTSEKSYRDAKLWSTGEYEKYLFDGAMQAASTGMSSIQFIDHVSDVAGLLGGYDVKIVLDNVTGGQPSLSSYHHEGHRVLLAVGPERGWSDSERSWFAAHGFECRTLGRRVLRTETACSAGVAVLLSRMGLL